MDKFKEGDYITHPGDIDRKTKKFRYYYRIKSIDSPTSGVIETFLADGRQYSGHSGNSLYSTYRNTLREFTKIEEFDVLILKLGGRLYD